MANIRCTGDFDVLGQSQFNGPVILGQSEENTVQFEINGKMNETTGDGDAKKTILGVQNDDVLYVGNPAMELKMRSIQTRPTFISRATGSDVTSELALSTDVATKADLTNSSQTITAGTLNVSKINFSTTGGNGTVFV